MYGNYKEVKVINPNQKNNIVSVDACISEEVQKLNNQGIITLGCCCGHGEAGKLEVIENQFGLFKEFKQPPSVLISIKSVELAKYFGYKPYPYFYADGTTKETWQMSLKTGCVTKEECEQWHKLNHVPYKENIGFI
ncbi:hypothetical protein ACFFGV_19645 [Pontibacillus salicampi]|uniref:Uncharacterized protein n=1 Tax=Pontibacillus salicampi TaxID=1449801 RepID=A0ABV6LTP5_9BACI